MGHHGDRTGAPTETSTAAASASARRRRTSASACRASTTGDSPAATVASSAASVSLSARTARASGWRAIRCTRSARPSTSPACGPPSNLSPLTVTRSAPARSAVSTSGSSGSSGVGAQQPAAEVGDQRHPVLGRQRGQPVHADGGDEAVHAVVAGMHLEQAPGLGADRAGVVARVGAVGRADLPQPGPGRRDEVGQPEAGADLDQLAPADHDLAAGGERGGGQHQGGRAVVDDQGVLGRRDRRPAPLPGRPRRGWSVARSPGRVRGRRNRRPAPAPRPPGPTAGPGPGWCGRRRRWRSGPDAGGRECGGPVPRPGCARPASGASSPRRARSCTSRTSARTAPSPRRAPARRTSGRASNRSVRGMRRRGSSLIRLPSPRRRGPRSGDER